MEPLTVGIGLGISAFGAFKAYGYEKQASEAEQEKIRLQQQAEKIRMQGMELDATRRKREMVRQAIMARSISLATATSQGASQGSALQGAYGGISGRTGVNELGVNQNLYLGRQMFQVNEAIGDQQIAYSKAKSSAAMWSSVGDLGNKLMGSAEKGAKIGSYFGNLFKGDPSPMPFYGEGGMGLYSNSTGSLY